MKTSVIKAIASTLDAYLRCKETKNNEWKYKHETTLHTLCRLHLPRGSGFDAGTSIDLFVSKPGRLVFHTSFHHMDEHGGYDGWTDHTVVVKPSLVHVCDLRVTGRDRNDIKQYIGETVYAALMEEIEQ